VKACKNCAICVYHGKHNKSMVPWASRIFTKSETKLPTEPKPDVYRLWQLCAVPSPPGAFGGLAPQTKLQAPQIELWSTINWWCFYQDTECQAPWTNVKPPHWKLSGDGSDYVATCVICNQQYVGQTLNKFSIEWTSHPSNWNKPDIMDDSDQIVLPRNYSVFHDIINKPTVYQALTATFVK